MTFQPPRLRARKFLTSLRMLPSIFRSQCSESFSLHGGKRQPCQKPPSTKLAILRSRSTKSGRPGRSLQCSSPRIPAPAMSSATARSGLVPFRRIRDITALRVATLMMSPRWSLTGSETAFFLGDRSAIEKAKECIVDLARDQTSVKQSVAFLATGLRKQRAAVARSKIGRHRPVTWRLDADRIVRAPASPSEGILEQPRQTIGPRLFDEAAERAFRISGGRVDQQAVHRQLFVGQIAVQTFPERRRPVSAGEGQLLDQRMRERVDHHEARIDVPGAQHPGGPTRVEIGDHRADTPGRLGAAHPLLDRVGIDLDENPFSAHVDRGKPWKRLIDGEALDFRVAQIRLRHQPGEAREYPRLAKLPDETHLPHVIAKPTVVLSAAPFDEKLVRRIGGRVAQHVVFLPPEFLFRDGDPLARRPVEPRLGRGREGGGVHLHHGGEGGDDLGIDFAIYRAGGNTDPVRGRIQYAPDLLVLGRLGRGNVDPALHGREIDVRTAPLHGLETGAARLRSDLTTEPWLRSRTGRVHRREGLLLERARKGALLLALGAFDLDPGKPPRPAPALEAHP